MTNNDTQENLKNVYQQVDDSNVEIDLKEIIFVIRKRWKLILLITLLSGLFSLYRTYTKIPVYKTRVTVSLESPGKTQTIFGSSGTGGSNLINNELQKLKSRSIAEEVVTNLINSPNMHPSYLFNTKKYEPRGMRRGIINKISFANRDVGISPTYSSIDEIPKGVFDQYVSRLKSNIEFKTINKTDIIELFAYSNSSQEAANIANEFANTYQTRDLAWGSGEVTNLRNFLENQLKVVEVDLIKTENDLRMFKEKEEIYELGGSAQIVLSELSKAESKSNNATAEIKVLKEQKNFIYSRLSEEEKTLTGKLLNTINNRLTALRVEIAQNEADLVKNTNLYGENHEAVRAIQTKIDKLKSDLSQQTNELIAQGISTADPIQYRQNLMDRVLEIEAKDANLKAQSLQYNLLVKEYSKRLGTLPAKSMEFAKFERDRSVLAQTYRIMRQKLEEAKISEASEVGKVRIIDYARAPRAFFKPNTKTNVLLGLFLGFIAAMALLLFKEILDSSIKSINDVEKQGVPVLGTIPEFDEKDGREKNRDRNKVLTIEVPESPISEAYRSIRTNILYSSTQNNKSILITSPSSGEGKSTTISNLAVLYAKTGKKTLLIDADLRKPVQHRIFNVKQEPGLVHLLLDMNDDLSQVIQPTEVGNLSVITSGAIPPNPAEILGSEKMVNLLARLEDKWDIILIDTPPILVVTDASLLAKVVDNLILVLKSGSTEKEALVRSQKIIANLNTSFSGTILNGVSDRHSYYSNYYYRGYYKKDDDKSKNILDKLKQKLNIS